MTGYVTDLLAKMPETVGALTGVDIHQWLRNLTEGERSIDSSSEQKKLE